MKIPSTIEVARFIGRYVWIFIIIIVIMWYLVRLLTGLVGGQQNYSCNIDKLQPGDKVWNDGVEYTAGYLYDYGNRLMLELTK